MGMCLGVGWFVGFLQVFSINFLRFAVLFLSLYVFFLSVCLCFQLSFF